MHCPNDAARPSTLELTAALAPSDGRRQAAHALAGRLGVEEVLLFVRDPQLGRLLPAPGFAQTLRGGPEWRSFLHRCRDEEAQGVVDLPEGTSRQALALRAGATVAVLLGGPPRPADLALVRSALPLVGGMLEAEHALAIAATESAEARETALRAQGLSVALEAARAQQARLNADLTDQQQRKDEFLAMLAHELRNPLSPLLNCVEILARRGDDEDLRARQLTVMSRQLSHLRRLVDDLLDVSRVSRGRIHLQRKRVSLRRVLEDALEACHSLLHTRGHVVTLDLPPDDDLPIDGDPVRLTQVFANLLNNAAKYTDPGGRVTVTARRDAGNLRVDVRDDGIGIERELLPRVFDLFTQGPVTEERSQGGLGIGLTLVRTLVDLHGGSIHAESEGLGHGSTFSVRLPSASSTLETDSGPSPTPTSCAQVLRVLVVDDNRDAADSLASMLQLTGHQSLVAYGGQQALEVAVRFAPDLVFLDIGLPDISGYDVAQRLRIDSTRRVPRIVALTGYGGQRDVQRAMAAGFDEHVVKPLSPHALDGILARTTEAC